MIELIVTNGDSAADIMRKAGFDAEILPWRDVLHEGPVPEAPNLESLSAVRGAFLADAFDEPKDDVVADMEQRDRMLRQFDRYDGVTLWFEHDLYDQLQLLQILDFFHSEAATADVHLVQADDYLGLQTPEGIQSFAGRRALVSVDQKALAAEIFGAFRQSTPVKLTGFLELDLSSLPHMEAALRRLFEELPDAVNGLSRTQRQALTLIESEAPPPKQLFGASQAMEEAMFMGDSSFWRCLEEMIFNKSPLIDGPPARFGAMDTDDERRRYLDAALALTETGHAVLTGEADHAEINKIDRWLGGTYITNKALWRWDRNASALVSPS